MQVTTRGLLYERPPVVEVPVVEFPFQWNEDWTVCTLAGGGDVVFKGIIRGADMKPITYIGPSVESVTQGLALPEWIYVLKGGATDELV